MKPGKHSFMSRSVAPLLLVATLLMSCGQDTATDDHASSVLTTGSGAVNATDNSDNGSSATATTDRYNATGQMDPTGNYTADGSLRPGVVLTSSQERSDAVARMNGIRATLMTELTEVRTRLKDGTMEKEVMEADKKRAADLAQGLERVDRALAAMGGATDATWAEMRDAQLKEVNEVRSWWTAHVAERDAMAKQE